MRRLVVPLLLSACASPALPPARAPLDVRLARPVDVRVVGEGPPLPVEGWGEPSGALLAYVEAFSVAASEVSLAAIGVEFQRSRGLQSVVLDPFQLAAILAPEGIQLDSTARNASLLTLMGGSQVMSLSFSAPDLVQVEIERVRFGRLTITVDVSSSVEDKVTMEVTVTEERPVALVRLRADAPYQYLLLALRQITVRR